MNFLILLVLVFYIIPTIICWVSCRKSYVGGDEIPKFADIFLVFCPIVNILLAMVSVCIDYEDVFQKAYKYIIKKLFWLK